MKPHNLTIFLFLGALVLHLPGWAGDLPQFALEYVRVGYTSSFPEGAL
jgi:hypothetical protein